MSADGWICEACEADACDHCTDTECTHDCEPGAAPMPRTVADALRLDHLLGIFRVGSGDWSWQEEHDQLYARPYQVALTEKIAQEGIREPVLLGSDGRVWDGHHRICAAMHLGLDAVPVEWASERAPDARGVHGVGEQP